MIKRILFLIAIIGVFIVAKAETDAEKIVRIYNTAVDLENTGKYSEAIKLYTQVYMLGEKVLSPMKLAELYEKGGTSKDYSESDKWLRIAADNGNKQAQCMLGDVYYYSGNLEASAFWYLKSAEQGYPGGQYKIALAYLDGEGVSQNNAQGLLWLRKAADNNYADAQDALAIIYGFGKNGIQRDVNEFVKWALRAAENGSSQSQYRAGSIYLHGIGGIKADKNKAIQWFKKAAAQGEPNAIQELSEMGY